MQFLEERSVKYVEFEVEIPEDEKQIMLRYAKKNILNDEKALLNWAVNTALESYVKTKTKTKKTKKMKPRKR